MDKRTFTVLMALFIVFVGFQFAEPAAAVKVVDHGTKYGYSGQNGWMKVSWKSSLLQELARSSLFIMPGSVAKWIQSWRLPAPMESRWSKTTPTACLANTAGNR